MTAEEQVKKARLLWLDANPNMKEVEEIYRSAIATFLPNDAGHKRKRDLECWQQLAIEQFCMILCQSGRSSEAKEYLLELGYTCRLASCILDYPESAPPPTSTSNSTKKSTTASQIACHAWDDFLSDAELQHLQDVFLDPQADYWTSHHYQVEPPSPYFSYIIPLHPTGNVVDSQFGGLGQIIDKLKSRLVTVFPKLASTTAVELWAHNRPPPTGHQFHFDSDNEGQGRMIKNPIVTAILYLSGSAAAVAEASGGPSVVTNQSLVSKHLATKAVMSLATQPKRVVAFDGTLLHGVIPGKGTHRGERRVTLMLAFWRRIRVRPNDSKPGAARPFPFEAFTTTSQKESWNRLLVRPIPKEDSTSSPIAKMPIPMDRVYETLDGEPWTKQMGFPEYDQVFQGF